MMSWWKKNMPTCDLPFKANSVLLSCIVWIIVLHPKWCVTAILSFQSSSFNEIRFNNRQHLNYCNPCCPQPSALCHTRVFFLFFLMLRCCHLQLNFCTRLSSIYLVLFLRFYDMKTLSCRILDWQGCIVSLSAIATAVFCPHPHQKNTLTHTVLEVLLSLLIWV